MEIKTEKELVEAGCNSDDPNRKWVPASYVKGYLEGMKQFGYGNNHIDRLIKILDGKYE